MDNLRVCICKYLQFQYWEPSNTEVAQQTQKGILYILKRNTVILGIFWTLCLTLA